MMFSRLLILFVAIIALKECYLVQATNCEQSSEFQRLRTNYTLLANEKNILKESLKKCKNDEKDKKEKDRKCLYKRSIIETIYDAGRYDAAVSYFADPLLIPEVFTTNVTGVVLPIARLDYWKSRQYFFVLGSNIQSFGAKNVGGEVTWHGCEGDDIHTSVLIRYDYPNGSLAYYFHQLGYWRFDQSGKIYKYLTYTPNFLNYHWLWTGQDYRTEGYTDVLVNIVCDVHEYFCSSVSPQYSNRTQCVSDLSVKQKGSPEDLWGDSALCRAFHSQFIVSPFVDKDGDVLRLVNTHCVHVSKSGGGACIDRVELYGPEYFDFVWRFQERILGSSSTQNEGENEGEGDRKRGVTNEDKTENTPIHYPLKIRPEAKFNNFNYEESDIEEPTFNRVLIKPLPMPDFSNFERVKQNNRQLFINYGAASA